MKKNLRNILALSLGLMTTVAFAQDWNGDSRTRIDMGGDHDKFETSQRATLGCTWGGSDWGIHTSTEINYDLGGQAPASLSVYEAYASADLMGYASMTAGRQALDYGSGLLIGSNQWGNRQCRDGMTFGLGLDFADVTFGWASRMSDGESPDGGAGWLVNAAKADGDWNANFLYGSQTATTAGVESDPMTYMGLDLGYAVMDGALALSVMYNTLDEGWNDNDYSMTAYGLTYNVNDAMSISASHTTYGEHGFNLQVGNIGLYSDNGGSWMSHGNMGHLRGEDQNISVGGAYSMGGFDLGVTMHTVTNDNEDGYERNAMEMSVGYSLNDNAGLSLNVANDNNGGDTESKYMWLTLTVNP